MKFRQAKKILKMVAYNRFIEYKYRRNYKKAETVYMHHFRKRKKKVTVHTIMPFVFPEK